MVTVASCTLIDLRVQDAKVSLASQIQSNLVLYDLYLTYLATNGTAVFILGNVMSDNISSPFREIHDRLKCLRQ